MSQKETMKPTQDTKLHERIVRMFLNATESFEWTDSKAEIKRRSEIVATQLLSIVEDYGYSAKPPDNGTVHSHIWDNETPNRLYSHSHTKGDIPHCHHGSKYWKVEKEMINKNE